jgi:hypothetical protein
MENLDLNQSPPFHQQSSLSDAKTAQILGVLSIVITFCTCCYGGVAGIVLGFLGLTKAKKAIAEYDANPGMYLQKSYNQAKTAKTLSIIGIVIGALGILYILFALIFGFASALTDIASKGF